MKSFGEERFEENLRVDTRLQFLWYVKEGLITKYVISKDSHLLTNFVNKLIGNSLIIFLLRTREGLEC